MLFNKEIRMTFWEAIQNKLAPFGDKGTEIPHQRGVFHARLTDQDVMVSNLGKQPFLPMEVFNVVEELLNESPTHQAMRGMAMRNNAPIHLGDTDLSLDSVEGRIANEVYQRVIGESVFRRITPVACLLVWAGVCHHGIGVLIANPNFNNN